MHGDRVTCFAKLSYFSINSLFRLHEWRTVCLLRPYNSKQITKRHSNQPGKFFILFLAKIYFSNFNSSNRWAVVIAERVNQTDAKAMEDAVQEAVTG